MKLRFFLGYLLCIGLISCGGGGGSSVTSSGNSCDVLGLRVANGDNCSLKGSPVVPLILLTTDGGLASCTGTMVSLTSVLTAGHCVSGISDISVVTGSGIFTASEGGISQIAVHPWYSGGVALYDAAVIRLAGPVSNAPASVAISSRLIPGERFTVYGYGQDETGDNFFDRLQSEDYDRLLKAGEMEVTNVDLPLYAATFDTTAQSVCPGDSGGPSFVSTSKGPAIVGITSFGTAGNCMSGSFAAFTYLQDANIMPWLLSVVPDLSTL